MDLGLGSELARQQDVAQRLGMEAATEMDAEREVWIRAALARE